MKDSMQLEIKELDRAARDLGYKRRSPKSTRKNRTILLGCSLILFASIVYFGGNLGLAIGILPFIMSTSLFFSEVFEWVSS